MNVSRRSFLFNGLYSGLLSGLAGSLLTGCGVRRRLPTTGGPLVDFHVHLFGIGDGGTGCFLSDEQKTHANYRFLRELLGIPKQGGLDRAYVDALVSQLRLSAVDRAVLMAQDKRYDEMGRPLDEDTHFYVPNDYLLAVCADHPDLFVPCVSVNPQRRDAIDELERCAEAGARVLKVHPPTQVVDPGAKRYRPFYKRVAELDVILMVHTGTEHQSSVEHVEWGDPARLRLALDEGCTVIAAHSGFGSVLDTDDFFDSLEALVLKYPRLYCDTGVLASLTRFRTLPRLLANEAVLARAVHASDFPFPSNALAFWNKIATTELTALLEERNLFERDLRLKLALGLPAETFTRGAQLLGLG